MCIHVTNDRCYRTGEVIILFYNLKKRFYINARRRDVPVWGPTDYYPDPECSIIVIDCVAIQFLWLFMYVAAINSACTSSLAVAA